MSSFQAFASKYRALSETGYLVLHRLSILLDGVARSIDEEAGIQSRFKSMSSTWSKMNLLGLAIHEVTDLIGVRLLVDDEEQCYAVSDAIVEHWPDWQCEIHDYVARPKANGYQSIHVHVSSDHGLRFEVQIRTRSMHQACEEGEAAHWRYKLTFDTDHDQPVHYQALSQESQVSEHSRSNP